MPKKASDKRRENISNSFIVNQHFQPRPDTVYDVTQYASLLSNICEGNQPIVTTTSHVMESIENNQQYDYENELFLTPQDSIQQNLSDFTPINSAIDQFATDYFNEDDYVHWQTQDNDEKHQDEGF